MNIIKKVFADLLIYVLDCLPGASRDEPGYGLERQLHFGSRW